MDAQETYSSDIFFLIKQLFVNSKNLKRLEGQRCGANKNGLKKKDRSLLVFFEYSINHNLSLTQFFFHFFLFSGL